MIFRKFLLFNNITTRNFTKITMGNSYMGEYEHILKFWYGDDLSLLKTDKYQPNYKLWFMGGKETDDLVTAKFEATLNKAFKGEYDHWRKDARGSTSLLILFDQFSRNIYRGSAKMFSYDPKSLEIAKELIGNAAKFNELSNVEKMFVYLCFVHSENETDLVRGMNGMKATGDNDSSATTQALVKGFYSQAVEHHDVVKQFGRYPHRNDLLGRKSTPEEINFLATSEYAFVKSVRRT